MKVKGYEIKSGADLSGADLSRANLSLADLSGAYLSWADLSGADLSGAYLSGADLSRANLSGAIIDDFRFFASGLKPATVKHLMALDFRFLGNEAERIVLSAIEQDKCPFNEKWFPPFYVLAGNYWGRVKGYFTTSLSFKEIWGMVVKDLREAGGWE